MALPAHLGSDVTDLVGLDSQVEGMSRANGLDPAFVRRIITQESAWNPSAKSPKGAMGLMQVMPATAADYGVTDLLNPSENLKAGITHLARLNKKFNGNQELVAAAYNAGEGNVAKAGGVPDFPETKDYVAKTTLPTHLGGDVTDQFPTHLGADITETVAALKPSDEKKATNVAAYKTRNPGLWEKIVDAGKQAVSSPTAFVKAEGEGLMDLATGAVKGAASTAINLGSAVSKIPVVGPALTATGNALAGGDTPAVPAAQAFEAARAAVAPSNTLQRVGKGMEQVAEFAVPAGAVSNSIKAGTTGAGLLTRVAAQGAGGAGVGGGVAAAHNENPVVGAFTGGVAGAVAPVVDAVAPALANKAQQVMRAALKPSKAAIKEMPGGLRAGLDEQAETMARYVLDKKLTPANVKVYVEGFKDRLDAAVAQHGDAVVPGAPAIEAAIKQIEARYGSAAIPSDIKPLIEKLYEMTPGPATQVASKVLGANGQPIMTTVPGALTRTARTDVTAAEALDLAQRMKAMNRGSWGTMTGPAKETGKAIESSLRTQAKSVPEIADAQAGHGMAIAANRTLENAAHRIGNREVVSPFGFVSHSLAVPTLGASELVAKAQSLLQKHPIESAHKLKGLADSIARKNYPMIAKILARFSAGGVTQATAKE